MATWETHERDGIRMAFITTGLADMTWEGFFVQSLFRNGTQDKFGYQDTAGIAKGCSTSNTLLLTLLP
jgi:hypothetical protein